MKLDKYEIIGEIGRGGFGVVYKARDTVLERFVALKVLHPQLTVDPRFVERFKREARTSAGLDYPHIVTIYEVGDVDGQLYIAMELARGPSVVRYIQEHGAFPWEEALEILEQAASALDYAHERGFVHRDIKPSNILLDPDKGALLGDFGLSKAIESSGHSLTTTGGILGTPAYIAPEIWDGERPTPASDIYALACVFYEMITGDILFDADSPLTTMKLHSEGPQLDASEMGEGFKAILLKALEECPDERYRHAGAFAAALRGEWERLKTEQEQELRQERIIALRVQVEQAEREKQTIRCPSCDNIVTEGKRFCGSCGHQLIPTKPVAPAPTPDGFDDEAPTTLAPTKSDKAPALPAEPAEALTDVGVERPAPALPPAAAPLPSKPKRGLPGWVWGLVGAVVVVAVGGVLLATGVLSLPGQRAAAPPSATSKPDSAPTSSSAAAFPTSVPTPVGCIAYSVNEDGPAEIYVMNADGSNMVRLTDDDADDWGAVWSPDGRHVVFTSDRDGDSEIYVMDADGSNVVQLTNNDSGDWAPFWSPDGMRIAFTSVRDGDDEIYVMDADGGNVVQLTDNDAGDIFPAWSPDGMRIVFASRRDGDHEIYVMDADGGNVAQLTNNNADEWIAAWSPDGRRIAFTSDRDGDFEIYVMDADGSNIVRLTDNDTSDIFPFWSPDGARIAFTSDRDGDNEIYVMDADGSDLIRLTDNRVQDTGSAWSP